MLYSVQTETTLHFFFGGGWGGVNILPLSNLRSSHVLSAEGKVREDDNRLLLARFQEPFLTLDTFVRHSPLQVHTGRVLQHDQVVPHVLHAPWWRDACDHRVHKEKLCSSVLDPSRSAGMSS
jgi:hypothetical protein